MTAPVRPSADSEAPSPTEGASGDSGPQSDPNPLILIEDFEGLIDHLKAYHGLPACFDMIPGSEDGVAGVHDGYHDQDPPRKNFGQLAPPHRHDAAG